MKFFKKQIEKIFKNKYIVDYVELKDRSELSFTLNGLSNVIDYNELKQLFELLNTEDIGFEGDFEYGYYNEIDSNVKIYCLNVKF